MLTEPVCEDVTVFDVVPEGDAVLDWLAVVLKVIVGDDDGVDVQLALLDEDRVRNGLGVAVALALPLTLRLAVGLGVSVVLDVCVGDGVND